ARANRTRWSDGGASPRRRHRFQRRTAARPPPSSSSARSRSMGNFQRFDQRSTKRATRSGGTRHRIRAEVALLPFVVPHAHPVSAAEIQLTDDDAYAGHPAIDAVTQTSDGAALRQTTSGIRVSGGERLPSEP